MGRSKRPSRPKPPSGEEKQNQLDLFIDWAKRAAAATAAAAVAAKEAAARKLDELDKRALSICGVQVGLLVACSYRPTSLFTVIVVGATALTALMLVIPWVASRVPSHADRAARGSNFLLTFLLIVSIISWGANIAMPWLSSSSTSVPPTQQESLRKVEPPPAPATPPGEKLLTEEAQKEAAAQAEKEAARLADCLLKEKSAAAARRTHSGREQDFARCRTEYETAVTLKGLDTYCGEQRRRLDAAARALNATVANMCSSTGSIKSR